MINPNKVNLKRYAAPFAVYAGLSTLLMSGCGDGSTKTVTERVGAPGTPAPMPAPAPNTTAQFPPIDPNTVPAPTFRNNKKRDFPPIPDNNACQTIQNPIYSRPNHQSYTDTIHDSSLVYGFQPIFQGDSIKDGKVSVYKSTRDGGDVSGQAVHLSDVDNEPPQLLQFEDPSGSTVEFLVDAPKDQATFDNFRRAEIVVRICTHMQPNNGIPGASS